MGILPLQKVWSDWYAMGVGRGIKHAPIPKGLGSSGFAPSVTVWATIVVSVRWQTTGKAPSERGATGRVLGGRTAVVSAATCVPRMPC